MARVAGFPNPSRLTCIYHYGIIVEPKEATEKMFELWILPHDEGGSGRNYSMRDSYNDEVDSKTLEQALVRAGEEDAGDGKIRIIKYDGRPVRFIHRGDGLIITNTMKEMSDALVRHYGERIES